MSDKADIRRKALDNRKALSAEERHQKSKQIREELISLPEFKTSQTVMTYLGFRDEVETVQLARETLKLGKRLFIPLCNPLSPEITACEILNLDQDIHPGSFGILEPLPERIRIVSPKELDLVIVPGVAFDRFGNRIGFGKGYYDWFLPKLRDTAFVIGLAFSCQVVDKIEVEEHDFKMSLLLTEKGVIYHT